jgi:hypothetical protein
MPGGLRQFVYEGHLEVISVTNNVIAMRTVIYVDGDVLIECAKSIDSSTIAKHNRSVATKLNRVLSRISLIRKTFVMIPVLLTLSYVIKMLQIEFSWTEQVLALLPALVLFPLLKWLMALACRRWITKFLV